MPVLKHLGTGAQAHVFGQDNWVVKVRRKSVLGFIGRVVSKRKWQERVRDELGDLVLPFMEVEDVEFFAPPVSSGWQSGKAIEGGEQYYQVDRALIMPMADPRDFLDSCVYAASPAELLDLLGDLLTTLKAVRSRGFYMVDFVMKNFVYWKGALRVADPGMVIPEESMWEPTIKIGSWGFAKGLIRDYLKFVRKAQEESSGPVFRRLCDLEETFGEEIDSLRARDSDGAERTIGIGQQFPADVEECALRALGKMD